ncbi:MAG: zinc ribbon domain-containing protein [Lachnospiraceae bacterium]|nr:zinc ribbon domain-containing protein [Lachnospiraceae bacterium]
MKRLRYYLSVLLIAITVCMSLTACSAGSTIETTLKINDDLSGVRVMDVAIDDSVFSESFNGTIEDLHNVIVANCPADLTYTYSDESGVKTYTFELAFSSLEDYKTKVTTLTGTEPTIDIQVPNTVWVNGFYISESFSSSSLLYWLRTAIVDAGLVSSSDASNIFEDGENLVEYNAETYSSYSSCISVDEVEYLGIAEIQILTELIDYDLVNETIAFVLPINTMEKKGDEVTAYLESAAPAGAETEWTADEFERPIFKITVNNIAMSDISAMVTQVFGTETSYAEVTEVEARPFALGYQVDYTIDLANYMAGNQNTPVAFAMSLPEHFWIGENVNAMKTQENFSACEYYDKYYYVGYQWVSGGQTITQPMISEKRFEVSNLNVATKRSMTGKFERVSEFTLDRVPEEDELAVMVARIDGKVNPVEEETTVEATSVVTETAEAAVEVATEAEEVKLPEYKFKVDSSNKDDVCKITVTQKGDAEGLMYTTALWTGDEGELVYGEKYELFKTKYQEGFVEDINFGVYDDDTTDDYSCTYTVDLGAFSNITYTDCDSAVISGGKAVLTNAGTDITVISERVNIWGILFYLLFVAGVALIVFVFVKTGVAQELIAKVKEKSATKAAAQPVAVPASASVAEPSEVAVEAEPEKPDAEEAKTEETVQTDAPKIKGYCTSCGTPYDEDACVCVKCGKKLVEE